MVFGKCIIYIFIIIVIALVVVEFWLLGVSCYIVREGSPLIMVFFLLCPYLGFGNSPCHCLLY